MPDALYVVAGAAVGAPLRYLAGVALNRRWPYGTLLVNVVGSAVLGLLAGLDVDGWAYTLLGTGFCGALTTYSAFGYETVLLATDGRRRAAVANVLANVAGGVAAAALAFTAALIMVA